MAPVSYLGSPGADSSLRLVVPSADKSEQIAYVDLIEDIRLLTPRNSSCIYM